MLGKGQLLCCAITLTATRLPTYAHSKSTQQHNHVLLFGGDVTLPANFGQGKVHRGLAAQTPSEPLPKTSCDREAPSRRLREREKPGRRTSGSGKSGWLLQTREQVFVGSQVRRELEQDASRSSCPSPRAAFSPGVVTPNGALRS